MVQITPTGKGGEVVEWRPADCDRGHGRVGATWAQCPLESCRKMCRQWRCMSEEACAWFAVDPDHVHQDGSLSQGARRGG